MAAYDRTYLPVSYLWQGIRMRLAFGTGCSYCDVGRSTETYVSNGQLGWAKTWITSGRVVAISLYTVHADARILRPPFSDRLRVNKHKQSVTVSVWNG
jgi:hypothetical protein